jgi:acyl-CoA reductase-like NAD-dependent aldehyde dehydrogenase
MNQIVLGLRKSFNSKITKSVDWRIKQLNALEKLLSENESEICAALKKDINKHALESTLSEIGMIKNAIIHALNHIDEYVKPKKVSPQFPMNLSYSAYVQNQPYGVVLVIGAWNYPFQLSLVPLVGAIASGNCVLIKPSELADESAKLIEKLVHKYLDQVGYLRVCIDDLK